MRCSTLHARRASEISSSVERMCVATERAPNLQQCGREPAAENGTPAVTRFGAQSIISRETSDS